MAEITISAHLPEGGSKERDILNEKMMELVEALQSEGFQFDSSYVDGEAVNWHEEGTRAELRATSAEHQKIAEEGQRRAQDQHKQSASKEDTVPQTGTVTDPKETAQQEKVQKANS